MNGELPEGWTTTTLGRICSKPQYGWTCRASKTGRLKYVRTTDISNGGIDWATVPYCEDAPEDGEKFRIKPNDILVSRAGSVGVSHRVTKVPIDAVFASYLIRFKPLAGISPQFIEFFLKSDAYWRSISEFSAGIAIPNVNASKLAGLELPVAPAAEQRRVVAKLQELIAKVDASRVRLDHVQRVLDRFRQSVLAAACSGQLTADWREKNDIPDDDWTESPVSDLLSEPLANGRSVLDAPRGFPVLRLTCLRDGTIDLSERKIGAWTKEGAKRFLVRRGDFLVSRGNGSLSHVGRGGLVQVEPDGVAYPDTLIRVRVRNDVVEPSFLQLVWNSRVVRSQIESAAHTTAGIWKISQGDIEAFTLPVPSLDEQREIVRRAEELLHVARRLEGGLDVARAAVDSLTPSILAKAFRGELVPTEAELAKREGREYEPASKLLDRIRADQSTAGAKERPTRAAMSSRLPTHRGATRFTRHRSKPARRRTA